jgi:hypothetical protein
MKSKIFMVVSVAIVLVLLAFASANAMSSANYLLNWFTPLSGSGGGPTSSSSYTANITIGQTGTGLSSSANYAAQEGYWAGTDDPYRAFLPLIKK